MDKLNLGQRLILYVSLILLVSLSLVAGILYLMSSRQIERQVTAYLQQITDIVNLNIDDQLSEYEMITLPLVTDQTVREFVELEEDDAYERFIRFRDIKDLMSDTISKKPGIEQIYLMNDANNYILAYSATSLIPLQELYRELNELVPADGTMYFYPRKVNEQIVFTAARRVRGRATYETQGLIAFDIEPQSFISIWDEVRHSDDSILMILNQEGEIIYHPDTNLVGEEVETTIFDEMKQQDAGTFYTDWDGENRFFHFNTSDYSGWKVATMLPRRTLLAPIANGRIVMIVVGLLTFCFSLLLVHRFIQKIVRPIRDIEKTMKNVERAHWELAQVPPGEDEITSLVQSYNKMVGRLAYLVDQVFTAELAAEKNKLILQTRELEKKKVEFQALQAQINPHFLYNTLSTINSYAILKEIDEISEMTEALANMFRYSTKNLEIVTIADEITHLEDYLLIQKYRWQKKIPVKVAIEGTLYQAEIVKLTLQPLVENAIGHAFPVLDEDSLIVIKAKAQDGELHVSVSDNGVGIEEKRLTELRAHLEDEVEETINGNGIGLRNVHKRIKILFGKQYGLDVESEAGKGTVMTMVIPMKVNENIE